MIEILIADDHEIVRRGLREILRDDLAEARISEAHDGPSTLAAIDRQAWDLVLLDLNMPGADGLTLMAEIKRRRPQVPILVLTVASETAFAVQSIQMGASGFLNKRDAADALVDAIRKVLSGETHLTDAAVTRVAAGLRGPTHLLPHEKLSVREFEVFRQLALGKAIKEIASNLELSEKTVGTYLLRIRDKTGLRTPVEIARYALQHQLVE